MSVFRNFRACFRRLHSSLGGIPAGGGSGCIRRGAFGRRAGLPPASRLEVRQRRAAADQVVEVGAGKDQRLLPAAGGDARRAYPRPAIA